MKFDRLFSISSRLPLILALIIIILSSTLWYLDYYAERDGVLADQEDQTEHLALSISNEIINRIELVYNVLYYEITQNYDINSSNFNQTSYDRMASPIYNHYPGYQTINWVNTSGFVNYVFPYATNAQVINQSLIQTAEGNFNQALHDANQTYTIHTTSMIDFFQEGSGIASYLPVVVEGNLIGFLNVLLRVSDIISTNIDLEDVLEDYYFQIIDNNQPIYYTVETFDVDGDYTYSASLQFYNQDWSFFSKLQDEVIEEISLFRNSYIVIIGVFFALFAGFSAQLLIRQNILQEERFEEQKQYEKLINRYEKINALGTMAGGLAHDFNNLLMSISGNLSILKILLQENGSKEINEAINGIAKTIEKSKDLTQQILIFSRHSDIEEERIDLFEILKDTITIFDSVRSKSIELITNFNHTISVTNANFSRLSQSFLNILNNALDAISGPGYIEIDTYTVVEENELPEALRSLNISGHIEAFFLVEFIDSGSGISDVDLNQIFDPFYTTKATGKGTGLGLSITYQYITSLGGDILVKSELGVGTKFSLYIPLFRTTGLQEYESNESVIPPNTVTTEFDKLFSRSPNILLIEDEEDIAKSITRIMMMANLEVVIAGDGQSGLQKYFDLKEKRGFDIVISDINLPRMNGLEVITEIRKRYPHQPVIFITGFNEVKISSDIIGDYEIIQKPFNQQDLFSKIKSILENISK